MSDGLKIHQRTTELFKEEMLKGLRCTCGWPAETDTNVHSPDCEWEDAWQCCLEQAKDEAWAEQQIAD